MEELRANMIEAILLVQESIKESDCDRGLISYAYGFEGLIQLR